ncbi:MAG: hypothetical protein PHV75_08810 [Victivallaceae bacterium]|nr:hypothetical protein [Victivallaceae bacterium]
MKKIGILFWFICTLTLFADSPGYWLVPGDSYKMPKAVNVELTWRILPLKDLPLAISNDMNIQIANFSGEFQGITSDYHKGFPVAKIDLNGDSIDEWIVDDSRAKGQGGTAYWIYQKNSAGEFHNIGKVGGWIGTLLEKRNDCLQLRVYRRCGMNEQGFQILTYNPKTGQYEISRDEWHCYEITHKDKKPFTCEIRIGRIADIKADDVFFAYLENVIRTTVYKEFKTVIWQDDIVFFDNSPYYRGFKDASKKNRFAFFLAPSDSNFRTPYQKSISVEKSGMSGFSLFVFWQKDNNALSESVYRKLIQDFPQPSRK